MQRIQHYLSSKTRFDSSLNSFLFFPWSYHENTNLILLFMQFFLNQFGGVFVEVSLNEGGTLISLDRCFDGATTALIVNRFSFASMYVWQEGHFENRM